MSLGAGARNTSSESDPDSGSEDKEMTESEDHDLRAAPGWENSSFLSSASALGSDAAGSESERCPLEADNVRSIILATGILFGVFMTRVFVSTTGTLGSRFIFAVLEGVVKAEKILWWCLEEMEGLKNVDIRQ